MPFTKILLGEVYSKDESLDTQTHANLGIDVFNQGQQIPISANTSLESQEEISKKEFGTLDDYPI